MASSLDPTAAGSKPDVAPYSSSCSSLPPLPSSLPPPPPWPDILELYPGANVQRDQPSAALHTESHTSHGSIVHDVIIGFADGLTVPFALTAGLSSLGSAKLVIVGGLAELFAGSISMGLGAYLAALTDREKYMAEERRERNEIVQYPEVEVRECQDILEAYGISSQVAALAVRDLCANRDNWLKFMMDLELKIDKPKSSEAVISALSMGFAYLLGGIIPMIPYFAMTHVAHALFVSTGITVVILVVFGFVKNWVTVGGVRAGFAGAAQTLIVGALAAGASYGIVKAIDASSLGVR